MPTFDSEPTLKLLLTCHEHIAWKSYARNVFLPDIEAHNVDIVLQEINGS